MNKRLSVIIQTSKDRIRYLDTTFNSITKVLPVDVDVYIACDKPSYDLLNYLTSNNSIMLNDLYLYPNENKSWLHYIGCIENKTHVNGIHGKYTKVILQDSKLHRYEKLTLTLHNLANEVSTDYTLYVEDDVIFKEGFYNTIIKCMLELDTSNIGRVSMYKYMKTESNIKYIREIKTGWKGPNVCLLLKNKVLQSMGLDNYKFNEKDSYNSSSNIERSADVFFANLLQKYTNSAILVADSVCQHIGILSTIYENVNHTEKWHSSDSKRCYFNQNNSLRRIDTNCIRPFVL